MVCWEWDPGRKYEFALQATCAPPVLSVVCCVQASSRCGIAPPPCDCTTQGLPPLWDATPLSSTFCRLGLVPQSMLFSFSIPVPPTPCT